MIKDTPVCNRDILILNVDDNDRARYVKTRILPSAGFQGAEAANGTDALTLVRRLTRCSCCST